MGPVAGAVLTGGASSRMGRTKALVEVRGIPMASIVATALSDGGCAEVALVGGEPGVLAPVGVQVVPDRYPDAGPLGAVLTALAHFSACSHVMVAACDLPGLDAATVGSLLRAAESAPDCDAVVARTDRLQPACAVWNRASIDRIEACFADGERAVRRVLAQLVVQEVAVAPSALLNVNRPDDVPRSGRAGQ